MKMATIPDSRALLRRASVTALNLRRTFMLLPKDVFPRICEWLSVRDIFSLRLVNKDMYGLTRNSTIWLSLLRRLTLPLPPGQPILPDSSGYYPLHTLEFSVCRALKLERNWRDYNPLSSHYQFNGFQRIFYMRFLPGGKYMVSVSQEDHECIVVWDMNYRGRRNHVALAMLNSDPPVHKLQARYAQVNDQVSLVVAFTRPLMDGKTVISVTSITVDLLENLSRLGPGSAAFAEYSKLVPNPFTKLLETRTRYPVGALSLGDVGGRPVLATVHRPRTITFDFLNSGTRASLKLAFVPGYDQWRHSIWDIKLLSLQKQILVIRVLIGEFAVMDTTPLVFEMYDFPPEGVDKEDPIPEERKIMKCHGVDGFYVSDAEASWWSRTHCDPRVPMVHRLADCPPPPISIFVTTKAPRGFLHFLMIPELTPSVSPAASSGMPACVYKLPTGTRALYEWDEEEQAVIIPGAYRSVVWMRSPRRQPSLGIEILRLAVYRTEGCFFSDSWDTGHRPTGNAGHLPSTADAVTMDDECETRRLPGELDVEPIEKPEHRYMKFPVMPEDVARAMRGGTWCLQFDEWLGRLCVATTRDNMIHVLDWSI